MMMMNTRRRQSEALDADGTQLIGRLSLVSSRSVHDDITEETLPALQPRATAVLGERLRLVASLQPPGLYAPRGFANVLRRSYYHVALRLVHANADVNDARRRRVNDAGVRGDHQQKKGEKEEEEEMEEMEDVKGYGASVLHVETSRNGFTRGEARRCSGLARSVVGAAAVKGTAANGEGDTDEVAVVIDAVAMPAGMTRNGQARATYEKDSAVVEAVLEVAQYEPPAGISGSTPVTPAPSVGASPRESVSEILAVLPSLLDSPRASISSPRAIFEKDRENALDVDSNVNGDDDSPGNSGGNGSWNASSPLSSLLRGAVGQTSTSRKQTKTSIGVAASGTATAAGSGAQIGTEVGDGDDGAAGAPLGISTDGDAQGESMEHSAAALAASVGDRRRETAWPDSLGASGVPSHLPGSTDDGSPCVAVLRRRWRRKISINLSPLGISSSVHPYPGGSSQPGASLIRVLLSPKLSPGESMRIESMKLVASTAGVRKDTADAATKDEASGEPPRVALVYMGAQEKEMPALPMDVAAGSVASVLVQPVVVRSPPEDGRKDFDFDLIIAVRCGAAGDRILLRHATEWKLPSPAKMILSVEAIPKKVDAVSSPVPPQSSARAGMLRDEVDLRIHVTNTSRAAMDLVLVTDDGTHKQRADGRAGDGAVIANGQLATQRVSSSPSPPLSKVDGGPNRSHVWVQSELPLGEAAPGAARSARCSVVPLGTGPVTLDSIRILDRKTGTHFSPVEAPIIDT